MDQLLSNDVAIDLAVFGNVLPDVSSSASVMVSCLTTHMVGTHIVNIFHADVAETARMLLLTNG
jgi:hypothetical protein